MVRFCQSADGYTAPRFIGDLVDAALLPWVPGEQTVHGLFCDTAPPSRTAIAAAISPSRYAAMIQKRTGRCACGAVRFGFDIEPDFAVCHCLDCKSASGGESMTLFSVAEDDLTLLSGQPKAFHYTASSGKGLDRNFCPACGTRLFTSNAESYLGMVVVSSGSLDNNEGVLCRRCFPSTARLGHSARCAAIRDNPWMNARGWPRLDFVDLSRT